jgi:predicted Zn-dependent peptidase
MRKIYNLTFLFLIVFLSFSFSGGINLPTPEKIVLDNGLTVYYLYNSELPIVSFRLLVANAGTAYETSKLEGISSVTATLLLKGTENLGAEEIADQIDFMGAFLNENSNAEYTAFEGDCLSEHFSKLFSIASDSILKPALKDEEFKKEISKRVDDIISIKDNPRRAVNYYFRKAYFGNHPLGNLSVGNESSLKAMSLDDVKKYFKSHYRPDVSILSVVGNIDKETLIKIIGETIAKWQKPSTEKPTAVLPKHLEVKGRKIILIDKPDATQTYFVLGKAGIPMGDKLAPEEKVVETLFGGRFTSWLNTELRIKRGLTYGARTTALFWKNFGLFYNSSYTKNKSIGEMLDIVLDLQNKARSEGFSEKEIESSINYISGQFPPELEDNPSKADAYAQLAFYGLGFDYYSNLLEGVKKVSIKSANKAADQLIPEDDFVLVLLGKASEIRPLIKKFGTFTEKKVSDIGF